MQLSIDGTKSQGLTRNLRSWERIGRFPISQISNKWISVDLQAFYLSFKRIFQVFPFMMYLYSFPASPGNAN